MRYGSAGAREGLTKFDYAAAVASSLAILLLGQRGKGDGLLFVLGEMLPVPFSRKAAVFVACP